MKRIMLIVALYGITTLFAQTQPDSLLITQIPALQKTLEKQNQQIEVIEKQNQRQGDSLLILFHELGKEYRTYTSVRRGLNDSILSLRRKIDSLNQIISGQQSELSQKASELGSKIQNTSQITETRISDLGVDFKKNRSYWIVATLGTLLLVAMMYLFLGKRIKSSQTDLESQIKNTRKSLEIESLKLDSQLVEVFQKQLEVIETTPKGKAQDEDHSLVLKIADRLTAMETNLYRMDPNTRGLNNLKNLVKSTKENFKAKEYEIAEMLRKEYKEGMEVIASFIPSDEIEVGKKIITQVIKPQVNFKGKKIQTAQVVVSIGE